MPRMAGHWDAEAEPQMGDAPFPPRWPMAPGEYISRDGLDIFFDWGQQLEVNVSLRVQWYHQQELKHSVFCK
jgi:hypothetical protein